MIFFNNGRKLLKIMVAIGVLLAIILSKTLAFASGEAPLDFPPIHMIILDANEDTITVGEWKRLNFTQTIVVKDLSGNEAADDVVIEDGFSATIDGEEYVLSVFKQRKEMIISEIHVGPKGIKVETIKLDLAQDGHTNIAIKNERGDLLADDAIIFEKNRLYVMTDQARLILEVIGRYKSLKVSCTVEKCRNTLLAEGATEVTFYDNEGNRIVIDTTEIKEGFIVDCDGMDYWVTFNLEEPSGRKESPITSPPVDVPPAPMVIFPPSEQSGLLDQIEKEEAKARAELEARAKAEAEEKARAEQDARAKAEAEVKARAEQDAKVKAEAEEREKIEQEAKIKAEAEAKIKAEILTKVEAKINAEMKAKAKLEAISFMKQVDVAFKLMDKKVKNWQEAKKEWIKVDQTAKSIKLVNGKPDMKQVANVMGQYQVIVNVLFKDKKYIDVVHTVSSAVEVLSKKKVDKKIMIDFVKKNIHTSKSMQVIMNDIKKQKLDIRELVKYQNELKKKEAQRVEGNKRNM